MPDPAIPRLPPAEMRCLRRVARIAAAHGRRVWLVGGPVRDLLLGAGGGDLDLAIDGAAQTVGRAVARELGGSFRWHPRFLAGRVELGAEHLDLVRTRTETYGSAAALPRVRPADLEQDLARRDFSINAMALRVPLRGPGRLCDPLGGRDDLARRLLRVLHDASFVDDPTRAFRALRLAQRLGFGLERATRQALRSAIERGLHQRLSGERVAAELRRALAETRPYAILRAFSDHGLATFWGAGGGPSPRLRYANRRLAGFGEDVADPHALRLACAFADHGHAERERIAADLRLRRGEKRALLEGPAKSRAIGTSLRLARGRADVDRVCGGAGPQDLVLAALLGDARIHAVIARWWSGARDRKLEIDGRDLRAAGIAAGPGIARGLAAARAALLEGRAADRASQLRVALRAGLRT